MFASGSRRTVGLNIVLGAPDPPPCAETAQGGTRTPSALLKQNAFPAHHDSPPSHNLSATRYLAPRCRGSISLNIVLGAPDPPFLRLRRSILTSCSERADPPACFSLVHDYGFPG